MTRKSAKKIALIVVRSWGIFRSPLTGIYAPYIPLIVTPGARDMSEAEADRLGYMTTEVSRRLAQVGPRHSDSVLWNMDSELQACWRRVELSGVDTRDPRNVAKFEAALRRYAEADINIEYYSRLTIPA